MEISRKARELAPAGTHTAVLYQIVDLGTHLNQFSGKVQRRVRLGWELSDEKMSDGRSFAISHEYTASTDPKATLAQHIKSWIGQDVPAKYDIAELLGQACNLTVIHEPGQDGNTYAKVAAIAPLKKNETVPKQVNETVYFVMKADKMFNQPVFDSLPDFLKEKIQKSPEYAQLTGKGVNVPVEDDAIPAHVAEGPQY